MHTSLNIKPSWWLESIHAWSIYYLWYTTAMRLMAIILTDDAIKHTCVWPLAWRNKEKPYNSSTPFQSDFSPFRSPVKEKGKQGRMKGLTRAQWVNLNRNNRSVFSESIFCIVRKNWPNSPTASGSYGREGGRPADEIRVDFKVSKLLYRLNYSEF